MSKKPSRSKRALGYLSGFILAVIFAGGLGSVIQTQFNLLAMSSIGPSIDFTTRLQVTGYDLVHFAPFLIGIMAVTFLFSLPVAHAFARIQKRQFIGWCAAGTGIGFWLALQLIDHLAPMPTLIAATRTSAGTFFMVMSAVSGGAVYAWLSRYFRRVLRGKVQPPETTVQGASE
ncbi:hypothetical protein FM042_11625 [Aliidiomarina halalkaliphila]|uniref:Uncharacterized protein n=1 Tax=Aliidiomarina halalkaliphila TaxID=2593535 RepID=A0A552WZ09_9GAMM|nr:hypothetical protein [Aliidiomarina halalkaliphila]TRW47974.1 hypothetical protein FM042_11625 [Aliidiomarina halalkaliphila]